MGRRLAKEIPPGAVWHEESADSSERVAIVQSRPGSSPQQADSSDSSSRDSTKQV
ncbi:hypothetical protein IG631_03083 [Alternaria alternata]|nr:hypothetical protein IG631_03083 [Alternaria alternata]